jgi:TRAP-type C4-dicarboxylate transport system permease small subunit
MEVIRTTDAVLRRLERTLVVVAAAMLFLIMVIVTVDVALRYLFNSPLAWSYDLISLYLMVGLFFFALSDTLHNNGHVSVDILHHYMPARARHAAELVGYGCMIFVFAMIFYMSTVRTWTSFHGGDVLAGNIPWPTWLSTIAVPIGSGLIFLRVLFRFIGHTLSLFTTQPVISLPPLAGTEESF